MGRPTEKLSAALLRKRQRWQEHLEWTRQWRKARGRDYEKEYRARNHERYNTRFKGWLSDLRMKAFEALGGPVCKQCGFMDTRALQFDHVEGGNGRADRARFTTPSFYRHIIEKGTEKFQVLCANCNTIKRIVNREFGKERS